VILVSRGLYLGLVQYGSAGDPDASALTALTVAGAWVWGAALPVALLGNLAVAAAILTTTALPRWLGWLSVATAALTGLSLTSVIRTEVSDALDLADRLGFWLSLAWFLAAGVLLVLRAGAQPPRRT